MFINWKFQCFIFSNSLHSCIFYILHLVLFCLLGNFTSVPYKRWCLFERYQDHTAAGFYLYKCCIFSATFSSVLPCIVMLQKYSLTFYQHWDIYQQDILNSFKLFRIELTIIVSIMYAIKIKDKSIVNKHLIERTRTKGKYRSTENTKIGK